MNKNIFRAYDIRGIYPADLDQETARLIAKGYISYLIRKHGLQSPEIVVGKDNRPHGIELQDAFVSGLLEHGAQVSKVEDCTSPMLYFAVCDGGFDGGVSITASHNPGEYNGFKLLGKMAHSIAGDEIQEILKLIQNEDFESTSEGSIQEISIEEAYTDKISSLVQPKRSLRV
ncbi:MAG: hypothetical protein U1C97_01225, partial [Candidatus Gracilibacteria bacterium]|nr:hypothetical protein [Candidatus Gracilibacteria bacterium]